MTAIDFLRRFGANTRGNAIVFFGVAIPAVIGAAGLAIDFSRMHAARGSAQGALDAALLSGSRQQNIDDAGVAAAVSTYLAREGALKHDGTLSDIVAHLDGQALVAEATLTVPTTLMKLAGMDVISARLVSRVERSVGNVEIALVLDTTRSMEGSRLSSVKSAANQLVDTLFDLPSSSDKVKVGLVPFGQYVNVGIANRNASWMAVPPDTSVTTVQCSDTYPNATKSNCRNVTYTAYNDGVPYTYTVEECDWDWGAAVNVCSPVTSTMSWNGCAGARSIPLNVKDEQYSTRVPGIRNVYCPSPIQPLSNSRTQVKDSITAMTASGETYIPTGLVWGWRTLSNRAPFTESADDPNTASGTVRKYLVLMTDGYNTKSPRYPEQDHEGSDITLANQLTKDVCDNIKADTESKIEIYTIAFEVTDEPIKDILRYCATPGGAFFDAVDYSKLLAAFNDIGQSVSVARIAK